MISLNLSADEVRIIGCLMEKSVTTPDQYPLTLKNTVIGFVIPLIVNCNLMKRSTL